MHKRPSAEPLKQLETERVIVTEWRFAPGAETGWHRHEYDYVVVPLTTGTLLLETADGEKTADLKIGRSYARDAGVEHNVINANAYDLSFIEIELKP
jgi:quercetin dioxygenase-like cupin family protein